MLRFVWLSRIAVGSAIFFLLLGSSLSVGQSPPPRDGERPSRTEKRPAKPPRRPPPPEDRRVEDRRRPVVVDRELLITDLAVVEHPVFSDPNAGDAGVWSFRYLIEQMAGDQDPSAFAETLFQMQADRRINGYDVPGRSLTEERILGPWRERSGGGKLDLSLAPFKLLAVVNRVDLRQIIDGNVLQAGEGRFVFGALDETGRPLQALAGDAPGGMTVIFEYSLPAADDAALMRWVDDWHELGEDAPGSPAYDRRLARLTQRFTDRGRGGDRPNGSALNQIRTNEIALGSPWELREFHIDADTGLPRQATVAETPDLLVQNDTLEFANLLNSRSRSILSGDFSLPPRWKGGSAVAGPFYDLRPSLPPDQLDANFAIAEADVAAGLVSAEYVDGLVAFLAMNPKVVPLGDSGFVDVPWQAPGVGVEVRHRFALNTCSGCHRLETATPFLHIGFPETARDRDVLARGLGAPAALSAFLVGGPPVADPVRPQFERKFDDLERRKKDLESLLRRGPERSCLPVRPH